MSKETLLDVSGMTCPSCIRHIQGALRRMDGVSEVEVRMDDGRVVVKHDADRAAVPDLVEALRDAGYESSPAA